MATINELTKRIDANSAKHDKTVIAYRADQAILFAELDVRKAAEAAERIVAGLDDSQRQAILTELGGN